MEHVRWLSCRRPRLTSASARPLDVLADPSCPTSTSPRPQCIYSSTTTTLKPSRARRTRPLSTRHSIDRQTFTLMIDGERDLYASKGISPQDCEPISHPAFATSVQGRHCGGTLRSTSPIVRPRKRVHAQLRPYSMRWEWLHLILAFTCDVVLRHCLLGICAM